MDTFSWTLSLYFLSRLLITSCPPSDSLLAWWAWPLVWFLDLWRGWCLGECPSPIPCPLVPIRHRPPPPTNPPSMVTTWESTWLSRRTAAVTEQGGYLGCKQTTNSTVELYAWLQPQNLPADCLPGDVSHFFFLYETTPPESGQWMLWHRWAATLTEMELTMKVERRRSFLTRICFCFSIDRSDIFVFIIIVDYILGRILLPSGTLPWAGWRYDPPSLV